MELTIIMCTYNSKEKLDNMLRQLTEQEFKDFSVVIVDDGSTDETEKVVASWQDTFYQIDYFKIEHGGIGAARNYGVTKASGKYLYFLDVDDIISPKMLGDNIDLMKKYKADIVDFGYCIKRENDSNITRDNDSERVHVYQNNRDFGNDFLALSRTHGFGFLWNKIFKRDFIKNLRFQEINSEEDAIFIYSALVTAQVIVYNPKKYYTYIQYKNSLSHNSKWTIQRIENLKKRLFYAKYLLLEHWQLGPNYLIGHNYVRLVLSEFSLIASKKSFLYWRKELKDKMESNFYKELQIVGYANRKKLNRFDKYVIVLLQFRLYFCITLINRIRIKF